MLGADSKRVGGLANKTQTTPSRSEVLHRVSMSPYHWLSKLRIDYYLLI